MNRNFKRRPNNAKLPASLIMVIFVLLATAPILIPFVLIGIFGYIASKSIKSSEGNFTKESINKIVDDIGKNSKMQRQQKVEGVQAVDSETQKQLESLKSLYENGFMDRDEYEERLKNIHMEAASNKH